MAIKIYKPLTPSLRSTKLADRSHLVKDAAPKALTLPKKKHSGRNSTGRITVRHRGGGFKRRLRIVDFKREKYGVPAKVMGLYFDPNRSAYLALLNYADGEKRFIIAPKNIQIGATIVSGEQTDVLVGNSMKLKNVPSGTLVHCVEMDAGKGAKLARSAGNSLLVQGMDPSGKYVQVKMPSTEVRLINAECMATIGEVGNEDRVHVSLGKAGRRRNLGWRPSVRGMVMHPAQHPHGGGEGKGQTGGKAKDLWGHRIGTKTRKNHRTDRYILSGRKIKTRPDAK